MNAMGPLALRCKRFQACAETNLDGQLSLDSDAVAFIFGYLLSSNIGNRCLPCGYVRPSDWRVGKRTALPSEPMRVEGRISQRAIQSSYRTPTDNASLHHRHERTQRALLEKI